MWRKVVESCIELASRGRCEYGAGKGLEYFFALTAGLNSQLLAVFRHGPTRDLDVLFGKQLDDSLVGVRMLGIFVGHDLLDLQLDRLGGQIVAIAAGDARV